MTPAPSRRWFRLSISLRTLLILVAVLGFGFAWVGSRFYLANQQQLVAGRLRSHGCDLEWAEVPQSTPWGESARFATGYIPEAIVYTDRQTYNDPTLQSLFAEAREVFDDVQFLDRHSKKAFD